MKKYFRFGFLSILLIATLSACNLTSIGGDPFYHDDGGLNDYGRFPLIKPYDAKIIDKQDGWYIELLIPPSRKTMYYYIGLQDVKKVAVENGVIMAYTTSMTAVDESAGQKALYWFVIIPDKSTETGFENETDFLKYVQTFGIHKPTWADQNSIFQQFEKTGCLDWIPDCK